MPNSFVHSLHMVLNTSPVGNQRSLSVAWWLLAIVLSLGLLGEAQSADLQQTRVVKRSPGVTTKKSTKPMPNADDRLPEDPLIVTESHRLQTQRLQEQQKAERELLSKKERSQTQSGDLWHGFRQSFPFHSQVIALSEAASDGSRTLIVSEPPPHVTLGSILLTVGHELLLNHEVKSHPIGYKGWVKDVVMGIKGKDEDLQAMLSRLNQRLFFTSYKSYTLKIPVNISAKSVDLDLNITPEEMNRWVEEEQERFYPVDGGKAATLASVAAEQVSGTYISHNRGLVGWWIPKKSSIYDCRIPARQFALDADLVIGAIAKRSGIFVLGRERIVPVDVLPPLRFETLALLADSQDGQKGMLAQSYERLHEFAGTTGDGYDWAPILLSPQLRDTEYGSLLNITDQLLKSWSNSGLTKYYEFPYPRPSSWPPFPTPLPRHLNTHSLTYNWNTKGTGYVVSFGSTGVMALNRSGALPVSYIPEGSGRGEAAVIQAEERGYDYFAKLSDPNLVRVVQYAAMYQIFSAFNIARSGSPVVVDSYPSQLLESLCNELKNELRGASDSTLDEIAGQIEALIINEKFFGGKDSREGSASRQTGRAWVEAQLKEAGLRPGTREYDESVQRGMDRLKRRLVGDIKGSLVQFILNDPLRTAADQSIRMLTLSHYASRRRLPARYAETIERRAKGWIHTAVVVMSWNDARLEDLTDLLTRFPVVTTVAHWRFVPVEPEDIHDAPRLLAFLQSPESETRQSMRLAFEEIDSQLLQTENASRLSKVELCKRVADVISTIANKAERLYWDDAARQTFGPELMPPGLKDRLTRLEFEQALPGCIAPARVVEFHDRMYTVPELIEAVPEDFGGLLDLTVCNSVIPAGAIRTKRPNCLVAGNRRPLELRSRMYLYGLQLSLLAKQPMPFVDVIKKVHVGRPAYETRGGKLWNLFGKFFSNTRDNQ